jgi:putative peptide zinc metalloprotease protein
MLDLPISDPDEVPLPVRYRRSPHARVTPLDTSFRSPMWQIVVAGRRFQVNGATVRFLEAIDGPLDMEALTDLARRVSASSDYGEESPLVGAIRVLIATDVLIPETDGADTQPQPPSSSGRRDGMTFRLPLLSRSRLLPITSVLRWLFVPTGAMLGLSFIVASHVLAFSMGLTWNAVSSRTLSATEYGVAIALLLASIAFHELGHLSACERYGARHGEVGIGLFFIWPVAYANVNECWGLSRLRRAVVDAGGMYFHGIWSGACCCLWLLTGRPVFAVLVHLIGACTIVNLNPFLKFDGYWLLTDLSGVPSLHRAAREVSGYAVHRLARRPARTPEVLNTHPLIVGLFIAFWFGCVVFLGYLIVRLAGVLLRAATEVPARLVHISQLALSGDFGWEFVRLTAGTLLSCVSAFLLTRMVVLRLARYARRTWRFVRVTPA